MSRVLPNKLVPSTVPQEDRVDVIFSDSPTIIKSALAGDTLTEFEIEVTTIFDGTTPVASIGIDTDHEKYLSEAQCYLLAKGNYIIEDTNILSSPEIIKVYLTPDGSTQGTLTAKVRYLDT